MKATNTSSGGSISSLIENIVPLNSVSVGTSSTVVVGNVGNMMTSHLVLHLSATLAVVTDLAKVSVLPL